MPAQVQVCKQISRKHIHTYFFSILGVCIIWPLGGASIVEITCGSTTQSLPAGTFDCLGIIYLVLYTQTC